MTVNDRTEIEKSLQSLTDDDAVAILEGRASPTDPPEVDEAARAFAQQILMAPEESEPRGGQVVEFIRRQPWSKMAAGLLLGLVVGTALEPGVEQSPDEGSVVSSNVVFLDVTRGSGPASIPEVRLPQGEDWISFVTYPSAVSVDEFRIHLEQADDAGESEAVPAWKAVVDDVVGVGYQDSVIVSVRSNRLHPGNYRIRVESIAEGQAAGSTSLRFRVVE